MAIPKEGKAIDDAMLAGLKKNRTKLLW